MSNSKKNIVYKAIGLDLPLTCILESYSIISYFSIPYPTIPGIWIARFASQNANQIFGGYLLIKIMIKEKN